MGSLLGDGCISKKKVNKGVYYAYNETHKIQHKKYLLWKNRDLKFNYTEGTRTIPSKRGRRKYSICKITKGGNFLKKYYTLFYEDGKKRVTKQLLSKVDIIGLCVFYLDDGNYNRKEVTLCICELDKLIIREWLQSKFGYRISIQTRGLNFLSPYNRLFLESIKPLVPSVMSYKLYGKPKYKKNLKRGQD